MNVRSHGHRDGDDGEHSASFSPTDLRGRAAAAAAVTSARHELDEATCLRARASVVGVHAMEREAVERRADRTEQAYALFAHAITGEKKARRRDFG